MKAAYVKVPFRVEMRDVPVPAIGPDEVLVRVAACGICGTDLHFARDLAEDKPMPLGHEFVGSVEATGANARGFVRGTPVIVENHTYCGVCEHCKNGEPIYCTNLYISMNEPNLAEFVKTHARALHPYEGLTTAQACLAEPLTVALDLVEEGGIPNSSDVAVFGPGPIGLMAVRLAKLKGARRVFLVGRSHSKARLELGVRLGADTVIETDREDAVGEILKTVPRGVDRVFVTSPPKTIPDAMKIARFGAVIVYNGIDFRYPTISFDANEFHFKRLSLKATHSIPNLRFPIAIDLLRRKAVDPDLFISHTFDFADLPEALRTAEQDKNNVVKVMVRMER
jgi:L-iditol 2-dehydrogenase